MKSSAKSATAAEATTPFSSSPPPPSSLLVDDNNPDDEMSSALSQEPSPLELTTASAVPGISSRSSPEAVSSEPSSLVGGTGDEGATVVDSDQQQQQFYAAQQQALLQPQKLFDLNQLTEEEKIVLSASGSARLYQASSQDEIDAIMQQVLDSKTTDTILIVSPVGRQIVTCNENGDQIITRVMTTDHHHHPRPDGDIGFQGDSPDNQQIPEPVLDYSGQHAMDRQVEYVNGSSIASDLGGSPPQSVIYEKHLTPEHIEILNEQAMRKASRGDIQDMYADQAHAQQLVYDSNNNPHDQLEEGGEQIMKSGVGGNRIHAGSDGNNEVMGAVISNKPQMDLIYDTDGGKTTVFTASTTSSSVDGGQQKSLGMYTTSGADLETFMEGGQHQMVVQHRNGLPYDSGANGGPTTVYVVNEEEAMDLHSGLR